MARQHARTRRNANKNTRTTIGDAICCACVQKANPAAAKKAVTGSHQCAHWRIPRTASRWRTIPQVLPNNLPHTLQQFGHAPIVIYTQRSRISSVSATSFSGGSSRAIAILPPCDSVDHKRSETLKSTGGTAMSELTSELRVIFEELPSAARRLEDSTLLKPVDALDKSANEVAKAWGHSWLGYQSRVYYAGLQSPPTGAHFSSEWAFVELHTMGTRGNWRQFPDGAVEAEIRRRARRSGYIIGAGRIRSRPESLPTKPRRRHIHPAHRDEQTR